jgi:hypothetical protein
MDFLGLFLSRLKRRIHFSALEAFIVLRSSQPGESRGNL